MGEGVESQSRQEFKTLACLTNVIYPVRPEYSVESFLVKFLKKNCLMGFLNSVLSASKSKETD